MSEVHFISIDATTHIQWTPIANGIKVNITEGGLNTYAKQGKRYPRPRRCRSKARMSKEWRDRG